MQPHASAGQLGQDTDVQEVCFLPMIRVVNLSKAYGPNPLFDDVDFVMNPGERLGLVGRNGHGKTTLFRILTGEETPDDGSVVAPKHYRIGHLSQYLKFRESTVLGEACSALPFSEEGTDFSYRAEAALSGLGFAPDIFQQSPEELSGGYKIRLNLGQGAGFRAQPAVAR